MMSRAVTGVILAGGKSSRMGTEKALLKLDGRPFLDHVASTLQEVFDRVILIANDASAYRSFGLEMFGDVFLDCGPLSGIHSGLIHAGDADVFVSACDTPFITGDLVRYIAEFPSTSAVKIPLFNQQLHPLCGLYTQSCLPMILKRLECRHLRVLDLIEEIQATKIPISPHLPFYREDFFSNFNTPEDYPRDNNR